MKIRKNLRNVREDLVNIAENTPQNGASTTTANFTAMK
jgi:hypothetical protein